jgi:hypothetical protein
MIFKRFPKSFTVCLGIWRHRSRRIGRFRLEGPKMDYRETEKINRSSSPPMNMQHFLMMVKTLLIVSLPVLLRNFAREIPTNATSVCRYTFSLRLRRRRLLRNLHPYLCSPSPGPNKQVQTWTRICHGLCGFPEKGGFFVHSSRDYDLMFLLLQVIILAAASPCDQSHY